ncbi:hypothetical protein UlMin_043158 [Ulmus minor]
MEDEHTCIDNLVDHLGTPGNFPFLGAFYGVFDDHGGTYVALFIRENILRFIVEDVDFPFCAKKAIKNAFLNADHAFNGHLNVQLSMARVLSDWHIKGTKGSLCPLSVEPKLQEMILSEEDEFLILGCDGLWDVMTRQCAVTMARKELMLHSNPERCSRESLFNSNV